MTIIINSKLLIDYSNNSSILKSKHVNSVSSLTAGGRDSRTGEVFSCRFSDRCACDGCGIAGCCHAIDRHALLVLNSMVISTCAAPALAYFGGVGAALSRLQIA